jgi:hypothetical protein
MLTIIAFGLASAIADGKAFACTPTHVWDADGPIWCAEGPRVRLHGIAAREMDGTCRPGHPCPDMGPIEARNILVRLLQPVRTGTASTGHVTLTGAPPLSCVSYGDAKGTRTAARCRTKAGDDLSCKLIEAKAAAQWWRYSHGRYAFC